MNTRVDRMELAKDLTRRSPCRVQVAAVITDPCGRVVSWGWNHPGLDGMGLHAEEHAIMRANRKRLRGSTLTVAGRRNGSWVYSRPCEDRCLQVILASQIASVEFIDKHGAWRILE